MMSYIRRWLSMAHLLPLYRLHRARRLSQNHRDHAGGFRFAGHPTYFDPDWETSERDTILAQMAQCDVFVDIGANQGIYTCLAASKGLTVVAVEPEAANLQFLMSNVQANKFEVEVYPVALADKAGVRKIYGEGDTASMLSEWFSRIDESGVWTSVNSIDNLFADRWSDKKIFFKLDVEGLEFSVLTGASRMLQRKPKPCWLIETYPYVFDDQRTVNDRFIPLFRIMFEAGYSCQIVSSGQSLSLDELERCFDPAEQPFFGGFNFIFESPTRPANGGGRIN